MASIKSILAAVDRLEFVAVNACTNVWPGVEIDGSLRSAGHTVVVSLELTLVGRLGKIYVPVKISTDHTYQHSPKGDVIKIDVHERSVGIAGLPEGITAAEVLRTMEQLGHGIRTF